MLRQDPDEVGEIVSVLDLPARHFGCLLAGEGIGDAGEYNDVLVSLDLCAFDDLSDIGGRQGGVLLALPGAGRPVVVCT